jgi:hypothetical protein
MAGTPSFISTPRANSVNVASANTNRDGSGTISSLIIGASAGTKVNEIVAQAVVTTTAGMIRVFLSTDGATTWKLFDELPIAANTVSASAAGIRVAKTYTNLILDDSSCELGVTTHNSESINVFALGGDLT